MTAPASRPIAIVDCDVHPVGLVEQLADYVPEPWRSRHFARHRFEIQGRDYIYPPNGGAARRDSTPPPGGRPGALIEQQLLGECGVDYAILTPISAGQRMYDGELDAALRSAENDLWAATWLSKYNRHGRYWGSIQVSQFAPELAAREIERWAGHERMVQVYLYPDSSVPFGQRRFDPIYAAAVRHGLPVALHPKKATGMGMLSPVGFVSYHVENFTQWPMQFMGHLASLVFEGTFERFPTLRIVCLEGGFTWVGPFLWRLDRRWEALGAEVPEVKRPPSEYVLEHCRFATQPIEDIDARLDLAPAMEWMQAGRTLILSSDYPHYDFDSPSWVAARLPASIRSRVMAENALDLYGLPRARAVDDLDRTAAGEQGAAG